eukprot:31411-Pelagococcus_subviridis.AAC.3
MERPSGVHGSAGHGVDVREHVEGAGGRGGSQARPEEGAGEGWGRGVSAGSGAAGRGVFARRREVRGEEAGGGVVGTVESSIRIVVV